MSGFLCENAVMFCPWLFSFDNLLFRNKKLARKSLPSFVGMHVFMTKKLENVYVCNEHFTEDRYKVSYRYEMLGANTSGD